MPSVKIIHYTHKKNKDGTSPIIIQVFAGNGKRYKRTLANVLPEQWDDSKKRVIKNHRNYSSINITISDEFSRIDSLIIKRVFDVQRDFIEYFDGKVDEPKPGLNFKEIAALYVSSLKSGFSMLTYENRLNRFINESGIGDLKASQITRSHIDKYVKSYAGNKDSSIRTNIKIVRYACTFAAKKGYDVKSSALYEYELPKATPGIKNKLNKDELTAFKKWPATGKLLEDQDIFMLSYYLWGMRIGDAIQLKQEYIKNGRLVYTSGKSEDSFDIKLVKPALEIIERYLDGREYLFHYFTWKGNRNLSDEQNMKNRASHIKTITANINKGINFIAEGAGIKKHVSAHIGRHTFAKMAIESANDINTSMAFLGHNNVAVHQAYIKEIMRSDELDDAADKIFE